MGTHFRILAASSPAVWERFLAVEDLLRVADGWRERRADDVDQEAIPEYAPWFALLDRGCGSVLGYRCMSDTVRAERLNTLLTEGEWYAWIYCYAEGDILTTASLVERRAGEIVESRAGLGRGYLIRKNPYLFLEMDNLLGIPVRQCAP